MNRRERRLGLRPARERGPSVAPPKRSAGALEVRQVMPVTPTIAAELLELQNDIVLPELRAAAGLPPLHRIGRPRGTRCSPEARQRISEAMRESWARRKGLA